MFVLAPLAVAAVEALGVEAGVSTAIGLFVAGAEAATAIFGADHVHDGGKEEG